LSSDQSRETKQTESIAVVSKSSIETTIIKLGIRKKGRKIAGSNKNYELREPALNDMKAFFKRLLQLIEKLRSDPMKIQVSRCVGLQVNYHP